MPNRTTVLAALLTGAALGAAPLLAQDPAVTPLFREFALVQRLRVVCEHEHFGRVLDLIADLPSGELRAAVVAMHKGSDDVCVVVPWRHLAFDATGNLLQLDGCPAEDDAFPTFDATTLRVKVERDDAGVAHASGQVLLSELAKAKVGLDAAGGSCQGATVELTRGRVAFLHVAASEAHAGDQELHPTPWAALQVGARSEKGVDRWALALPMTAEALRATPDLREAILSDPLYRPRVYRAFRVPPPDYDAG